MAGKPGLIGLEGFKYINPRIKAELAKHGLLFESKGSGISGPFRKFGDPNYDTGEFIELKAIKPGKRGEYSFSRILRKESTVSVSVDEFADQFCMEAVRALGDIKVE